MKIQQAAELARLFTQRLVMRDYASAYQMTSREYQDAFSLQQMIENFESSVPLDWELFGTIALPDASMDDWPDKQEGDMAWFYVTIGGDMYSEAVIAIVAEEEGKLVIRETEFGRP